MEEIKKSPRLEEDKVPIKSESLEKPSIHSNNTSSSESLEISSTQLILDDNSVFFQFKCLAFC